MPASMGRTSLALAAQVDVEAKRRKCRDVTVNVALSAVAVTRPKYDRHVRLYQWMLETAAWRSLSCTAQAVYIELASRYYGSNNGALSCPLRELAERFQIGKATAMRALRDLEERRFIEAVTLGSFESKRAVATEWRLTEHACNVTGQPASRAFMDWPPPQSGKGP